MVAPAALATAAGLRQLAALLAGDPGRERRIGFAMTMVVLVSAAVLTLSGNWLRSRQELVSRSRAQLGLAEQIDAIRILGKHGYGASDLESRVHGPAWSRWDGGHVYIGEWLLGAASHARPGEHAVIVECKGAPREFASWQERLPTRRPLPRLLVGYQAQLAPAEVSFASRNGVFWTSRRALPFYSGMLHGGDADMRLLFDPQLGHPPEFNDLLARWPRGEPLTMRLATTLAADDEERLLVLLHDTDLRTTVTLDGRSREAIEPPVQLGEIVRHLYSVKASERASGIDIEVSIPLPAGAPEPRRVDLYEEPRCAAAPQTGS